MERSRAAISVDPLLGRRLKQGQYLVLAKLGEGGMGVVYQAEQTQLQKLVALKVMLERPESRVDQKLRERFVSEARLACKLQHTNIAQVFDLWQEDNTYFMAMEYIDGVDLSKVIQEEAPLPSLRALEVIKQLAFALEEAERYRIVHRDIKPNNIRLSQLREDGGFLLKVLDFGIAKRLSDSANERSQLTQPGMILGTPHYMAPEQISATYAQECLALALKEGIINGPTEVRRPHIEHCADLYAVGVILFQMLTGALPFGGDPLTALNARLIHDPPPLPETIPRPLRAIVTKLLTRDPYRRMRSASALIAAAQSAESELRSGRKVMNGSVSISTVGDRRQKHRWLVPVLLFFIAGDVYLFYLLSRNRLPMSPPDELQAVVMRVSKFFHPRQRKGLTLSSPDESQAIVMPSVKILIIPTWKPLPPPPPPPPPPHPRPPPPHPAKQLIRCETRSDSLGLPLFDLRPECIPDKESR